MQEDLRLLLISSFCLLLFSPNEAFPQRLAAIYLGGISLDLDELNSSLSETHLRELDKDNLYLGGFGAGLLGEHLLFGFEAGGFWQKKRSDSISVKLGGVDACLDIGYLFHLSERVKAYPFVGVGLGWTSLKFVPDQGTLTFEEVVSNPYRISEMNSSGVVLNFGVGTHWLLYQSLGEYKTENWYLGLRGGYKYMPRPSDWNMEGIDVSDGPEVSLTGPYLHFYLAWGPESEEEYEPFLPSP